jgi:hypothetical protein
LRFEFEAWRQGAESGEAEELTGERGGGVELRRPGSAEMGIGADWWRRAELSLIFTSNYNIMVTYCQ